MFKYPLAVTIDTNIFDAAKFDLCDASPLKTLENYVKNGKIKVVLSDIVVRESKRHIADQIKKICGIMRKARAAALEESTEHLISTIGLGEILRIVTNKGELISKGEEMFDDFLRTINTEILGADLIDVGLVLGDYFETKPPFENSEKKKSEFPDAFIAQQIRKRFGETEEVVIISNDKGFIRACGESENHLFFSSLGKLYNAISKEDAAYDETMAVRRGRLCRFLRLLQNGVLDGAKLPVLVADARPDEIAVRLQLPDPAADAVDAVLADAGKPLHGVGADLLVAELNPDADPHTVAKYRVEKMKAARKLYVSFLLFELLMLPFICLVAFIFVPHDIFFNSFKQPFEFPTDLLPLAIFPVYAAIAAAGCTSELRRLANIK